MMHLKHISTSISAAATSMLTQFAVSASVMHRARRRMASGEADTIPFFRGMAVGVDVMVPFS